MAETIAILGGTGNLGFGLALRLADAGYAVCIGSRDAARAEQAASSALETVQGGRITGRTNENAVAKADRLVVVTVPFASQAAVLKSVAGSWKPGQVALDATVPLATVVGGRPTQLLQPWQGSAAQQARSLIDRRVEVVSGLHTVSADELATVGKALDQDTLVCGDSKEAKQLVAEVLGRVSGLRVIDAGSLEASRLVEGITPLLIGINMRYNTHVGFRVTNLEL